MMMKTSLLLSVLSACVLLTGCQGQQKLLQRDAAVPVPSVTVSNNVRPASPDMYAGTTVPEVVRYALKQSGYTLCATGPANGVLYRQALPAVQYQTGPLRLRTALQMMAGPAWQLEVDDVQRVVCHSLREGYQLPPGQLAPVPAGVRGAGAGLKK